MGISLVSKVTYFSCHMVEREGGHVSFASTQFVILAGIITPSEPPFPLFECRP